MSTEREIKTTWATTNIQDVKKKEYQRDLAKVPPQEARRIDRDVRRSEWRARHPKFLRFLARVLVH